MPEHPAARTASALDNVITAMEHLVSHPRTQQNVWVAQAKHWLPAITQARADLLVENEHYQHVVEAYQAVLDVLRRLGLEIRQRDRTTWGYSWHGASLVGSYSSQAQAIEAALRERLG